jgi:hypothetical protein
VIVRSLGENVRIVCGAPDGVGIEKRDFSHLNILWSSEQELLGR